MKKRMALKMCGFSSLLLVALSVKPITSFGALVGENEAVAVADLWYAMQLNSKHTRIPATEKANRLDKLQNRQVLYLVSEDKVLDTPPIQGDILAYIIKYDPSGFVMVSGEDRIIPILVFDVESEFRWDHPQLNFLRYYVGKEMVNRWEYLRQNVGKGVTLEVHDDWSYLRSRLRESKSPKEAAFEAPEEPIYVLWETASWDQCDFYNDTVSAHNGNNVCVPTGCTATAMAIKMRFHRWPPAGNSSCSYTDTRGLGFSHSVNFGDQTYNWDAMPTTNLTQANTDVADLMYHAGVAVSMEYGTACSPCSGAGSGAWPTAYSMNTYFLYIGTTEVSSGDMATPIKESVRAGLPVIVSSSTHTVVADGYRETQVPYFHINDGHGGGSWYYLDQFPWGGDPTIDMACPYGQPPNYVYVDQDYSGTESGKLNEPYDTFAEGYANCPDDGQLWLKGPKTYAMSPSRLTKKMRIHSYEGDVTVVR